MFVSGYRYVRSAGSLLFTALLLVFCMTCQFAFGGLDRGTFDLMQSSSTDAVGWAWAPDSTSDGDGVEYIATLAGYQHAGASAPSVATTVVHRPGTQHADLQAFVTWIVSNHAHVQSAADLTLVKRVVTTVPLP